MIRKPDCRQDYDFILSYWLASYRANSFFASRINSKIFQHHHGELINIAVNTKQCLLYCDDQDRDHLLGFICGESPNILHYICVKKNMRMTGIGKQLFNALFDIPPSEIIITHQGNVPLFKGRISFNPYAFYRLKLD